MNTILKNSELPQALLTIQKVIILGKDEFGQDIEKIEGLLAENIKEMVKHELREIHEILLKKFEKVKTTIDNIKDPNEIEEFLSVECEYHWDGTEKEKVLDFISKNDTMYDTKFIVKHFCKK